jgi:hypothetical protein
MKIIKFNQIIEKKGVLVYYQVRQIINIDEYYEIPAYENEYEQNYDQFDIDDVINFVVDNADDYKPQKLKIVKITEEELPDSLIASKKYNI